MRYEVAFHYSTGKQLIFDLSEAEYNMLIQNMEHMDSPWFILEEEAINLSHVVMVQVV